MRLSFRAAIFDMDGTLFGTEQIAIDAVQAAFRHYGVDVAPDALESLIGRAGAETREFLGRLAPAGVSIDAILQRGRDLIEARIDREGMPIKHGAEQLLAYLHRQSITLGLATSTRTAVALENLRRSNLASFFRSVVGGDQVENAKPFPDVYRKALQELGAAPVDAIAIEDSEHGIRAACAAGLRVIHVPDIKPIDVATRSLVFREYATLADFYDELVSRP